MSPSSQSTSRVGYDQEPEKVRSRRVIATCASICILADAVMSLLNSLLSVRKQSDQGNGPLNMVWAWRGPLGTGFPPLIELGIKALIQNFTLSGKPRAGGASGPGAGERGSCGFVCSSTNAPSSRPCQERARGPSLDFSEKTSLAMP